jgi:tRNA A58 N-methylase Trm61
MSPAKVVELLNPQPASTLLDLGAGCGLFTFMLAPAVGENGTVFFERKKWKALGY